MAPAKSLETIKKSLVEHGFYDLGNPVAAERFEDLERRNRRFQTAYGVDFLKVIVLNPRIRRVLKEFYPRVTLGHTLIYGAKRERIFSFSLGGDDTFFIPGVHIWKKGAVVDYWVGSQNHRLPTIDPDDDDDNPREPLPEYTESSLVAAGCKRETLKFDDGALVLVDARIAFTRTTEPVVFSVFFPDYLVPPPKMILTQWTQELEDQVDDLQSDEIGANFEFKNREIVAQSA